MRRAWSSLAAALCAFGCFNGTEVGNPEVTARVSVIQAQGWEMRSLSLKVLDVTYYARNDSGTVWNRPGGFLLDAADSTANVLPVQKVPTSSWTSANLDLAFPRAGRQPEDS